MHEKSISNNRKISLHLKGFYGEEKYKRFDVESTYLESDEDVQFHSFGLTLIKRLSEKRVVKYSAGYRLLKQRKRKFFSKIWTPAVFGESVIIDELHKELIDKQYPNSWFGIKLTDYDGSLYGHAYKGLYLVQNQLDMDLFLRFILIDSIESQSYHEQIYIYPDNEVDCDRINTNEEVINYYSEAECVFLIVSHDPEPLIHIDINTDYFTTEELIKIVKEVADKHSFTLEAEDYI